MSRELIALFVGPIVAIVNEAPAVLGLVPPSGMWYVAGGIGVRRYRLQKDAPQCNFHLINLGSWFTPRAVITREQFK